MTIAQILFETTDLPVERRQYLVTAFQKGTLTDEEKVELGGYIRAMMERKKAMLASVREARAQLGV